MNWIKDLKDFDREYFVLAPEVKNKIELYPLAGLDLRSRFITEEYKEVMDAIERSNKRDLAKELADLIYVCIGTATVLGIDLERVFKDVHNSNMSKFNSDAVVNQLGKLLKSKSYEPPKLLYVKEEF